MRRNSIIGIVLAAVLLIVTIAGFRISSDNEQAIRLALGQKNYKVTGEEGPQYFEAEYDDAGELAADSAELGKKIQREGIVLLLNNDEVLPLRKGAMISVFGKDAVSPVYCSAAAASGAVSLKDPRQ